MKVKNDHRSITSFSSTEALDHLDLKTLSKRWHFHHYESEEWSSQYIFQFKLLERRSLKKIRTSTGVEPVTSSLFFSGFFFPIAQIGKYTAMIILHFYLQPHFIYELFHIYITSLPSLCYVAKMSVGEIDFKFDIRHNSSFHSFIHSFKPAEAMIYTFLVCVPIVASKLSFFKPLRTRTT